MLLPEPSVLPAPKDDAPLVPNPRIEPPPIDDMPPDNGDRLNDVRIDPMAEAPRVWNERLLPPPARDGMNPPNLPAYGMAPPPIPVPESRLLIDPPYPPSVPRKPEL